MTTILYRLDIAPDGTRTGRFVSVDFATHVERVGRPIIHAKRPGKPTTYCGQSIRKTTRTCHQPYGNRYHWAQVTCPQCLEMEEVKATMVERALR